jgi:hypothetical protein
MKVRELIKQLENLDPEMEVRVEADHGQYAMSATWVGEEYIYESEYMAECVAEEDLDPEEHIKIVLIQGY